MRRTARSGADPNSFLQVREGRQLVLAMEGDGYCGSADDLAVLSTRIEVEGRGRPALVQFRKRAKAMPRRLASRTAARLVHGMARSKNGRSRLDPSSTSAERTSAETFGKPRGEPAGRCRIRPIMRVTTLARSWLRWIGPSWAAPTVIMRLMRNLSARARVRVRRCAHRSQDRSHPRFRTRGRAKFRSVGALPAWRHLATPP